MLHIVHKYNEKHAHKNIGGPAGLPGNYRVVFILNRPGFSLQPEYHPNPTDSLMGDSHLQLIKAANPNLPDADMLRLDIETIEGKFIFNGHPNEKGLLGKISIESLQAENYVDAERKAYHALMPGLSNFSFLFDIPMNIYSISITEISTHNGSFEVLTPYREMPLVPHKIGEPNDEYLKYASFYREALNSNSPNYQFLCYYKIIEGIKSRQKQAIKIAKERGNTVPQNTNLKIPASKEEQKNWLNSIFIFPREWNEFTLACIFIREAIGNKVKNIIGNDLREIRNKIAHAVLNKGTLTLSIDKIVDIQLVNKWIPLTKYIARYVMLKEFFKSGIGNSDDNKNK